MWLLIVLLCLFGIGILAVLGTGAYVLHKARVAGVDAELFRTDPERAIAKMLAAAHPDLEVIESRRDGVTVRSRSTGKRFTLSFDDARRGRVRLEAVDENGKRGEVELGGGAPIPSWVPQYPGSRPEPVFSARGETDEGAGEAGNFRFETADSPSQVVTFYEERARELGITLHTVRVGDTVTLTSDDENAERKLKIVATRDGERTAVNVTYGRKR